MKAITIRQPWAALIALGVKRIETRSWSTSYRGPLAIHAGAKAEGLDAAWEAWCATPLRSEDIEATLHPHRQLTANPLPLGAVVAVVDLVDVVPIVDDYEAICHAYNGPAALERTPKDCLILYPEWDSALDEDDEQNVTDQLPFGVFEPGRFAWLLDNVRPLNPPVPVKGRQGLWNIDMREAQQ